MTKKGSCASLENEAGIPEAVLLGARKVSAVFDILSQSIVPHCELNHSSAFELLVAVVLSAQATDESVNKVTPALWAACKTPQDYVALGEEGLVPYIRTIGLYRNKAKSIVGLSKSLVENFGGEVPQTREELMSLPGVGRKSANVVLNVWFGQPTLAVDTHVFRVSNRLGLVCETTPEGVERALLERVPTCHLLNAHHYLLLLGRYTCTARAPHCEACPVAGLCMTASRQG